MKILLSHVRLFATPCTVAYQAPLSMEFSRQGYRSGLPFSSPGNLPYPGIKPGSLDCRQILYHLSHEGSLVLDGMVNKRSWNAMIKPTERKPSVDSRSMTFID